MSIQVPVKCVEDKYSGSCEVQEIRDNHIITSKYNSIILTGLEFNCSEEIFLEYGE